MADNWLDAYPVEGQQQSTNNDWLSAYPVERQPQQQQQQQQQPASNDWLSAYPVEQQQEPPQLPATEQEFRTQSGRPSTTDEELIKYRHKGPEETFNPFGEPQPQAE